MEQEPFIRRLGGEPGCRAIAEEFYARVALDGELRALFPGKTLRCAIEEFSAFLIQFLGGDESLTQRRWWLSIRESHARFTITEAHRNAWLQAMAAALRTVPTDEVTLCALAQFFEAASSYLIGQTEAPVVHAELSHRWSHARALDALVAGIDSGRDAEVLSNYRNFVQPRSVFVGVLSRMMRTGRSNLICAVLDAIQQTPGVHACRYAGRSLLHYSAGHGCIEVVSALLAQGADPNAQDTGSHSPLYRCANECTVVTGPAIARLLVSAGADVNANAGVTHTTPLHMAARRGFLEIAQALLDLGAEPTLRDSNGCTPLDRAVNCRKTAVAQLLERRMAGSGPPISR